MIFKRAVAKLRAQDWAAITIELVIVVVGVFMGVQAANWNEEREGRLRATSYLERIDSDLVADVHGYNIRIAFWAKVLDYGSTAGDFADSGTIPPGKTPWDVLLAYFQSSQLYEFTTTGATYDELNGAGELRLIRDLALRDELARYYTQSGNVALSERPAYREHVRGYIPVDIQAYIWARCYGSDSVGDQVLLACPPPTDDARIREVLASLRSDASLTREMRYWMSTMMVARLIGKDRQAFAQKVRDDIGKALGRAKS